MAVKTPWGTFSALYLVFFLMGAEMNLVAPLLPDISREFGASTAAAGGVLTAYVLCYAVTGPLLGRISDRLPRGYAIAAGMAVFSVADVLSYFAPELWMLIAARAMSGFGAAMGGPSIWAYLAERAAPRESGRAVSLGAGAYALGQVLGVPLGALVAAELGWRAPYLLIGAPMLVVAGVLAVRLPSAPVPASKRAMGMFAPWRDRRTSPALAASFLLQGARLGAYAYVGVLLAERFGYGLRALGVVGLAVGVGSLIGSVGTGLVIDRLRSRGADPALLPAIAAAVVGVGVVVACVAETPAVTVSAIVVWCAAGSVFFSSQQTYLTGVAPDDRATLVGWNNASTYAGVALGTTVLGMATVGGGVFAGLGAAFAAGSVGCCLLAMTLRRSAVSGSMTAHG